METRNTNPYHAGDASFAAPRTRATRWMIWSGAVALLLAVLCLAVTVLGMTWSFDVTATSSTSANPSGLADGISYALIPAVSAVPFALVGIVLLILGFVRRRPVAET